MSPELIESGSYGTPTDIWSLGITLIEMAEQRPPHSDVNPTIRALFLITSSPPATLQEPQKWSEEMASFLACCLVKDAPERHSAQQLEQMPFVQRGVSLGMAPVLSMLRRAASAKASRASGSGSGDGTASGGTIDLMEGTISLAGTICGRTLTSTTGAAADADRRRRRRRRSSFRQLRRCADPSRRHVATRCWHCRRCRRAEGFDTAGATESPGRSWFPQPRRSEPRDAGG